MDWNTFNNTVSQAVIDQDRVDELLEALDCEDVVRPTNRDGIYRGSCPVHDGDSKSFHLSTHGDSFPIYWSCHSRHCEQKLKPSLLGLVRGVLSKDPDKLVPLKAAVDFLKEFVGDRRALAGHHTPKPRTNPKPPPLALTREEVRSRLIIPAPYYLSRGYSGDVLDALDIGHSPKLKRTVIPVYDDQLCIGFVSRSEDNSMPRWKVQDGFSKSRFLFNFPGAARSTHSYILLLEGPGDVFRAVEAGIPAVASFGADVSADQAKKLALLHKRVYVVFDDDEAGRRGATQAVGRLAYEGVEVRKVMPPSGFKDIGEVPVLELAAWMDVFNKHRKPA